MALQHRKSAALLAGTMSLSVLAAACGGGGATTAPTTVTTTPTAAVTPNLATGQKVVWWVPGPDAIEGTSQAIAAQCSTETGNNVDMQIYPWDGYTTKITTAITSGQVPDLVEIGNTDAPTLANTGAFMPWGDAELAAIGGKDQFVGESLSAYVPAGQEPPSVPFNAGAWMLLYNKALFQAAGIANPPTTWAEFYETAKKLSDPSKGQYGVTIAGGTPGAMNTWAWIVAQQYGAPYYTADGTPQVTSPAMIQAMTDLASWVYPDQIMSPTSVADNSNGDNAIFNAGQAAMDITQNPQAAIDHPDQYGIGLIPLPDPLPAGGKPIMSHLAGVNLAVFKDTKVKAATLAVVKCLLEASAQVTEAKGNVGLPVTKAGLADPYFQTPSMQAYGKILANAAATPLDPSSSQLLQGVGEALVRLYQNSAASKALNPADVEQALQGVEATVKAGG